MKKPKDLEPNAYDPNAVDISIAYDPDRFTLIEALETALREVEERLAAARRAR